MMPSRAPQQHGGREFFAEYQKRQMHANENLVDPPRRDTDRPEFRDRQMVQDKGLNPMGAVQQSYSHRKDFYQSKNDGGTQPRAPYQRWETWPLPGQPPGCPLPQLVRDCHCRNRPGMMQAPGVYKKKTYPSHYPDRAAAMKQVRRAGGERQGLLTNLPLR